MAVVLTTCAFRYIIIGLCFLFLHDVVVFNVFFIFYFSNLALTNQTWKDWRYQHVLAICAIVHKGNIEETIMCYGLFRNEALWLLYSLLLILLYQQKNHFHFFSFFFFSWKKGNNIYPDACMRAQTQPTIMPTIVWHLHVSNQFCLDVFASQQVSRQKVRTAACGADARWSGLHALIMSQIYIQDLAPYAWNNLYAFR